MSIRDRSRLESAIYRARNLADSPELSDDNKAWIAQLMTIWVSGYLEATCREVMGEYTNHRADPRVLNYVNWHLKRIQNPNMSKILELVGIFDREYARSLTEFSNGAIKDNIDSVVALRNRIAHGHSVDISIGRIMSYFDFVKKLAHKMEELFG